MKYSWRFSAIFLFACLCTGGVQAGGIDSLDRATLAPRSQWEDVFGNLQSRELAKRICKAFAQGHTSYRSLRRDFGNDPGWQDNFEDAVFLDGSLFIPCDPRQAEGFIQIMPDLRISMLAGPTEPQRALYREIGLAYVTRQNYRRAVQTLEAVLTAQQKGRAQGYALYEKVEFYCECIVEGLGFPHRKAQARKELGFLQMSSGKWDEALDTFIGMGAKASAGSVEARLTNIFVDVKAGNLAEASEKLNGVRGFSNATDREMFRGLIFLRAGDWAVARGHFLGILQRDPGYVHAWRLVALCLEKLDEKTIAQWVQGLVAHGGPARDLQTMRNTVRALREAFGSGNRFAWRMATRDAKIQSDLAIVREKYFDRKTRLESAAFLKKYLAPREKGRETLAPVLAGLMEELQEIEARLTGEPMSVRQKENLEKDFRNQLEIITQCTMPQTVEALVDYIVSEPRDHCVYKAWAALILTAKFAQENWPVEWMSSGATIKIREYLRTMFTRENILKMANDENQSDAIFHNLVSLWEFTRNPEMIDFLIGILEQNTWPRFTLRAAEALKDSWALYSRAKPKRIWAQEWVERLKGIALDTGNNLFQRAAAVSALGGVKEEKAGVDAIAEILSRETLGSYISWKAMEVAAGYTRRGHLSTLCARNKVDTDTLMLFLEKAVLLLRDNQPQIAMGVQLAGEKAPSVNVVDVAELFGSLLSIIIRDEKAAGVEWNELHEPMLEVLAGLTTDHLTKAPPTVKVLGTGVVQAISVQQLFATLPPVRKVEEMRAALPEREIPMAQALEIQRAVEGAREAHPHGEQYPYYVKTHRKEAFPLYDYYGLSDMFSADLLSGYDPHQTFFRALFRDLNLSDLQAAVQSPPLRTDPVGKELLSIVQEDLGNFAKPVLDVEEAAGKIARGQRPYGLETWWTVKSVYRHIKEKIFGGLAHNPKAPYARALMQRNLTLLVISTLLDEWAVDSPKSRPLVRIKLLYSAEFLLEKIFKDKFPDTAAVTVDDRWMLFLDTIFTSFSYMPFHVTIVGHEMSHWLRGWLDIGMLGASVLCGIDYELRFLFAAKEFTSRPLEGVLGKIARKEPLTENEGLLIGEDFKEGVDLAFDQTIQDPKTAILSIFHNFEWPVNDWPWEDIMEARRLLPGETVIEYMSTGQAFEKTNTYREGEKLAGYFMGRAYRAGYLEGWQLFAELLVKEPEKLRMEGKRRINPAEAYFVLQVLGGMAGHEPARLRSVRDFAMLEVLPNLGKGAYPAERLQVVRKRADQMIYDFVRMEAMKVVLDEGISYPEIAQKAQEAIPQMLDLLQTQQAKIANDVLEDIRLRRVPPFAAPSSHAFDRDLSQEAFVQTHP